MVREESTDFPLRETLALIVSSRASGSSDRKDGSVEFLLACACLHVSLHPNAMNDIH